MATLYVRNFPEELHQKLRELAAKNKRSMNDEAIALICKALGEEDVYQKRSSILKKNCRNSCKTPRVSRFSKQPGTSP